MQNKLPVLLITRDDDWCNIACSLGESFFPSRLQVVRDKPDHAAIDTLQQNSYAAIISFLSKWVIPASLLSKTKTAINFHPGSCDYPGIGCYNFALYEGAKEYGAVCHYMDAQVDRGSVICENLFPVLSHETVASLRVRTLVTMLAMVQDIFQKLASNQVLPQAKRSWQRAPFRRSDLEALCEINTEMSPEEIARRVRAVHYPGYPGARLNLAGFEFQVTKI